MSPRPPWAPDPGVRRAAKTMVSYLDDPADRRLLWRWADRELLTNAEEYRVAYVLIPAIREAAKEDR